MRRLVFLMLTALLVSWAGAALLLDQLGERIHPSGQYDAIIVAGCRVDPDGRASPALERRTLHAVALWRQGIAPRIVLTGGVGTFPPAEAEAAAVVARAAGVPDSALLLESASVSTEENARLGAALLQAQGIDVQRIVVVSDSYHVFRARRVFGRYFQQVDGSGSTPRPWVRLRGSFREVAAVAVYAAQGRLSRG